jgi:hypothetical protein
LFFASLDIAVYGGLCLAQNIPDIAGSRVHMFPKAAHGDAFQRICVSLQGIHCEEHHDSA